MPSNHILAGQSSAPPSNQKTIRHTARNMTAHALHKPTKLTHARPLPIRQMLRTLTSTDGPYLRTLDFVLQQHSKAPNHPNAVYTKPVRVQRAAGSHSSHYNSISLHPCTCAPTPSKGQTAKRQEPHRTYQFTSSDVLPAQNRKARSRQKRIPYQSAIYCVHSCPQKELI